MSNPQGWNPPYYDQGPFSIPTNRPPPLIGYNSERQPAEQMAQQWIPLQHRLQDYQIICSNGPQETILSHVNPPYQGYLRNPHVPFASPPRDYNPTGWRPGPPNSYMGGQQQMPHAPGPQNHPNTQRGNTQNMSNPQSWNPPYNDQGLFPIPTNQPPPLIGYNSEIQPAEQMEQQWIPSQHCLQDYQMKYSNGPQETILPHVNPTYKGSPQPPYVPFAQPPTGYDPTGWPPGQPNPYMGGQQQMPPALGPPHHPNVQQGNTQNSSSFHPHVYYQMAHQPELPPNPPLETRDDSRFLYIGGSTYKYEDKTKEELEKQLTDMVNKFDSDMLAASNTISSAIRARRECQEYLTKLNDGRIYLPSSGDTNNETSLVSLVNKKLDTERLERKEEVPGEQSPREIDRDLQIFLEEDKSTVPEGTVSTISTATNEQEHNGLEVPELTNEREREPSPDKESQEDPSEEIEVYELERANNGGNALNTVIENQVIGDNASTPKKEEIVMSSVEDESNDQEEGKSSVDPLPAPESVMSSVEDKGSKYDEGKTLLETIPEQNQATAYEASPKQATHKFGKNEKKKNTPKPKSVNEKKQKSIHDTKSEQTEGALVNTSSTSNQVKSASPILTQRATSKLIPVDNQRSVLNKTPDTERLERKEVVPEDGSPRKVDCDLRGFLKEDKSTVPEGTVPTTSTPTIEQKRNGLEKRKLSNERKQETIGENTDKKPQRSPLKDMKVHKSEGESNGENALITVIENQVIGDKAPTPEKEDVVMSSVEDEVNDQEEGKSSLDPLPAQSQPTTSEVPPKQATRKFGKNKKNKETQKPKPVNEKKRKSENKALCLRKNNYEVKVLYYILSQHTVRQSNPHSKDGSQQRKNLSDLIRNITTCGDYGMRMLSKREALNYLNTLMNSVMEGSEQQIFLNLIAENMDDPIILQDLTYLEYHREVTVNEYMNAVLQSMESLGKAHIRGYLMYQYARREGTKKFESLPKNFHSNILKEIMEAWEASDKTLKHTPFHQNPYIVQKLREHKEKSLLEAKSHLEEDASLCSKMFVIVFEMLTTIPEKSLRSVLDFDIHYLSTMKDNKKDASYIQMLCNIRFKNEKVESQAVDDNVPKTDKEGGVMLSVEDEANDQKEDKSALETSSAQSQPTTSEAPSEHDDAPMLDEKITPVGDEKSEELPSLEALTKQID